MTRSFLAATSVLLALIVFRVFAAEEPFRIRSFSTDQPGEVSVLVQLPPGLTPKAADFDLLIDNAVVATTREIRGLDLNIMFLVDVSKSMKGRPLDDTKKALLSFLGKPRQQLQFELTSFADQDTPVSSSKHSREDIDKSVKNLGPVGTMTRLYDALYNALKKDPKDDLRTRRIIIVISDGKDDGSAKKLHQVMNGSKASLVPIYIVFRGKTELDYSDTLDLNKIAKAAGGDSFPTKDADKLTSALEHIYELEKNSLVVQFVYQWDNPERRTRDAAIKLQRPDASALTAEFPEAIPVPFVRIEPHPPVPWLLWLIAAVILSGGAVWGWRRYIREPQAVTQPPITIVTGPGADTPPPPPRHREQTLIGQHFPLPTVGQPTAMLHGVAGPVEGQEHSVEKEIFSIGAGADNDLSIGEDEYISSEHAYLRYEKGSLFIFDKASRNGTFVNDDKVPPTGVALRAGDRIKLGMSTFKVVTPTS